MNSGRLNKRITIRTLTQSTDGTGFTTNDSTADSSVWAYVKPISGKRNLEEGRQFNSTAYEITCRYDAVSDVSNIGDYQIIYGSDTLTVHSFTNPEEDNNLIKFVAVKG